MGCGIGRNNYGVKYTGRYFLVLVAVLVESTPTVVTVRSLSNYEGGCLNLPFELRILNFDVCGFKAIDDVDDNPLIVCHIAE